MSILFQQCGAPIEGKPNQATGLSENAKRLVTKSSCWSQKWKHTFNCCLTFRQRKNHRKRRRKDRQTKERLKKLSVQPSKRRKTIQMKKLKFQGAAKPDLQWIQTTRTTVWGSSDDFVRGLPNFLVMSLLSQNGYWRDSFRISRQVSPREQVVVERFKQGQVRRRLAPLGPAASSGSGEASV